VVLRWLVVLVAFGAVAASSALAVAQAPSLRLASSTPVKIRGIHFAAAEHVRLRIHTTSGTTSRQLIASSRGSFVAGLANLSYDPCTSSLTIRARGSAGSLAVLKLPQRQCPPA
jgi:hypothetical protein